VIATGDLGKIPKILIWNYTTLLTRIVLTGYHRNGISQLKFSSNTNYLLSIGQDYFHSLAIYDWRNSLILISCPTFSQKVFSVDFNPSGECVVLFCLFLFFTGFLLVPFFAVFFLLSLMFSLLDSLSF
jgi:WD40 repeat protein